MTLYYNNFINKIPSRPNMSNVPNVPYNMSNVPNVPDLPDIPNMNLEELEKQNPFNRSLNTREYRKEFSNIKEYTSSELLLVEIKTYLFYILVLLIIIVFKLIMY